jgi:hypothetical protein
MTRFLAILSVLVVTSLLAAASLGWAGTRAWADSGDLMRRAEEIGLFVRGQDPYRDPDMTYPPTALPVFAPLVAPFGPEALRGFWLLLNLAALAAVCAAVLDQTGRDWPAWGKVLFCLVVVASKPVRGGIGLGQFHLIPLALMLWAVSGWGVRRPIVAGLFVGVALVKPTMGLPLLGFLVVRRRWRTLATAIGFQGAALVASSAWLRIGPARLLAEWFALARGQQAEGLIDVPSLALRWGGLPPMSSPLLTLAILALGFAATWAWGRGADFGLVGFCAFLAAIFTYHRTYDLVLLIPALALAFDVAGKARGARSWPGVLAAVAFAGLLIAPSNPAAAGRFGALHDAAFIPMAYAFLGLTIAYVRRNANGVQGDRSQRRQGLVPAPRKGFGTENPEHRGGRRSGSGGRWRTRVTG